MVALAHHQRRGWGLGASVAGFVGVQITGGDVQEAVTQLTAIATAISGLIAVWGRLRAKRPVG